MQNATGASSGPLTGQQVGQYRFMGVIGRGGMGDVYLAHDEHLKRNVAIKALSSRLVEDDLARDRFVRETRLASQVVHPYVATVFDVVDHESELLLVMEHIEGRRLSTVLREDKPGPEAISAYAVEITEGLTAIHRAGLVHRDLKPGNVMVTPEGHVKLLDFGVARSMAPGPLDSDESELVTAAATLTEAGLGVGTVAYMSPEQVRGKKDLDERSDLFSLGTILWEAVTGIHPFRRGSVIDTASAILNEPPGGGSEPETLTGSGPLRHVILRLLEKDPDRRYPTSQWAAQDLRAIVQGQTPSLRAPLVPRRTARRWTIAALALLGAVAVFEAARRLWPPPPPAPSRPVIAVLPFEDRTGQGADPFRGEMLADLLAADLGESGLLRPVSTERVLEIAAGAAGASAAEVRDRLARHARLDWVLTGRIWSEGESLIAAVSVFAPRETAATGSFEVRAAATATLVDLASSKVAALLLPEAATAAREVDAARLASESEKARSLEYRARQALRELRYRDAIDLLEQATVEDPRFLMAQARLAEALHAAGYGERAREVADRVGRMVEQPGGAPSERQRLEIAAILARIGEDVPAEIEERRRLAAAFPDDPSAQLELARALVDLESQEEALPIVEKGIALDPLDPRGQLRLSDVLTGLGRHERAVEALERAEAMFLALDSPVGRGEVREHHGNDAFARGSYDEAVREYLAGAELYREAGMDVREARAIKSAGNCELAMRKITAAEERYRAALPVVRAAGDYRTLIKTLGSLGSKLYVAGEFDRAERFLREAMSLGEELDNPRLLLFPKINLAGLLNYTGRVGEGGALAAETLETARELGMPENETVSLLLIADAEYQTGDHAAAVQAYEDLVQLESGGGGRDRTLAHALEGLGEVHLASGRTGAALEAIHRAVALERDRADHYGLAFALLLRARVHEEIGRRDAADTDLQECQSLAEAHPNELGDLVPRIALARGLRAVMRGRWSDATSPLDRARTGDPAAVGCAVPALTAACEVAARTDDPPAAVRLCREALQNPRALPGEKTMARALLGLALARSGRSGDAEREARRALEESENRALPVAGIKAAEALLTISALADAEEVRRRGRGMLDGYLAAAPVESGAAIRRRADLVEAIVALDPSDEQDGGGNGKQELGLDRPGADSDRAARLALVGAE